jgi:hypothetical protein
VLLRRTSMISIRLLEVAGSFVVRPVVARAAVDLEPMT